MNPEEAERAYKDSRIENLFQGVASVKINTGFPWVTLVMADGHITIARQGKGGRGNICARLWRGNEPQWAIAFPRGDFTWKRVLEIVKREAAQRGLPVEEYGEKEA